VVGTATYDAYGQVLTQTGTLTPCGYAGQYTDAESGLQYLRARYYDPATQQFLTVDPLLAQTEQAYAYAGGSPTNASDPSGHKAECLLEGGTVGFGLTGTEAYYMCAAVNDQTGVEEWGILKAWGGLASTSIGFAGNAAWLWSPDAQSLDDLTQWSVDFGGTIGLSGRSAGITGDCNISTSSDGRRITAWSVGFTLGPSLGMPIEVHGGAAYAVILDRHVITPQPPIDNYTKILETGHTDRSAVPPEQQGGVPWPAP